MGKAWLREIAAHKTALYALRHSRPRDPTKCTCAAHDDTAAITPTRLERLPNEIQQRIYDLATIDHKTRVLADGDLKHFWEPKKDVIASLLRVSSLVGRNLVAVAVAEGYAEGMYWCPCANAVGDELKRFLIQEEGLDGGYGMLSGFEH